MPNVLDTAAKDALFHEAHSTSKFTDREVTDAELHELYALTRLSPTAVNSTPLRIVYARSAEAKARLLPLLAEGNRPKSESANVAAILAADVAFLDHLGRLAPFITDPRSAGRDFLEIFGFLLWDFKAMRVNQCHPKATVVSRDKKREPLSFGAPLDLDESD